MALVGHAPIAFYLFGTTLAYNLRKRFFTEDDTNFRYGSSDSYTMTFFLFLFLLSTSVISACVVNYCYHFINQFWKTFPCRNFLCLDGRFIILFEIAVGFFNGLAFMTNWFRLASIHRCLCPNMECCEQFYPWMIFFLRELLQLSPNKQWKKFVPVIPSLFLSIGTFAIAVCLWLKSTPCSGNHCPVNGGPPAHDPNPEAVPPASGVKPGTFTNPPCGSIAPNTDKPEQPKTPSRPSPSITTTATPAPSKPSTPVMNPSPPTPEYPLCEYCGIRHPHYPDEDPQSCRFKGPSPEPSSKDQGSSCDNEFSDERDNCHFSAIGLDKYIFQDRATHGSEISISVSDSEISVEDTICSPNPRSSPVGSLQSDSIVNPMANEQLSSLTLEQEELIKSVLKRFFEVQKHFGVETSTENRTNDHRSPLSTSQGPRPACHSEINPSALTSSSPAPASFSQEAINGIIDRILDRDDYFPKNPCVQKTPNQNRSRPDDDPSNNNECFCINNQNCDKADQQVNQNCDQSDQQVNQNCDQSDQQANQNCDQSDQQANQNYDQSNQQVNQNCHTVTNTTDEIITPKKDQNCPSYSYLPDATPDYEYVELLDEPEGNSEIEFPYPATPLRSNTNTSRLLKSSKKNSTFDKDTPRTMITRRMSSRLAEKKAKQLDFNSNHDKENDNSLQEGSYGCCSIVEDQDQDQNQDQNQDQDCSDNFNDSNNSGYRGRGRGYYHGRGGRGTKRANSKRGRGRGLN